MTRVGGRGGPMDGSWPPAVCSPSPPPRSPSAWPSPPARRRPATPSWCPPPRPCPWLPATVCLLNEERAAHGLDPVQENAALTTASLAYSQRLVAESFFAHEAPDGTDVVDRLTAAGYIRPGSGWSGREPGLGPGRARLAAQRGQGLDGEPGHKANVLTRSYREIGIGIVLGTPKGGPDGSTFTTNFGRRDAEPVAERRARLLHQGHVGRHGRHPGAGRQGGRGEEGQGQEGQEGPRAQGRQAPRRCPQGARRAERLGRRPLPPLSVPGQPFDPQNDRSPLVECRSSLLRSAGAGVKDDTGHLGGAPRIGGSSGARASAQKAPRAPRERRAHRDERGASHQLHRVQLMPILLLVHMTAATRNARRLSRCVAGGLRSAACWPLLPSPPPPRPPPGFAASPAGSDQLSDEVKLTCWAPDAARHGVLAAVHQGQEGRQAAAADRGRLRRGLPAAVDVDEPEGRRVGARAPADAPQRPQGVGAPRRPGQLQPHHDAHVVNRSKLRATLYRAGKRVFTARVGTPSTPTPSGRFWIREKFRVSGTTIYGTHAIGTSATPRRCRTGRAGRGGAARDQPARAHPGPSVARLRATAQRGHRAPLPAGTPVRIL